MKSTRAQALVRLKVCRWKRASAVASHLLSDPGSHEVGGWGWRGGRLYLLALSFFPPAAASLFLPWAAAVFWALSLGTFCAAAELEAFEGCVGFEVELEGCRRRLPSSPVEDE